jgi:hypothetical protein
MADRHPAAVMSTATSIFTSNTGKSVHKYRQLFLDLYTFVSGDNESFNLDNISLCSFS